MHLCTEIRQSIGHFYPYMGIGYKHMHVCVAIRNCIGHFNHIWATVTSADNEEGGVSFDIVIF